MSERPGLSIFDTKDERSANDADDAVALVEEELGQVGAVLPGDARDDCCFWHAKSGPRSRADLRPGPEYHAAGGRSTDLVYPMTTAPWQPAPISPRGALGWRE